MQMVMSYCDQSRVYSITVLTSDTDLSCLQDTNISTTKITLVFYSKLCRIYVKRLETIAPGLFQLHANRFIHKAKPLGSF